VHVTPFRWALRWRDFREWRPDAAGSACRSRL
jgi:hypothetical protein